MILEIKTVILENSIDDYNFYIVIPGNQWVILNTDLLKGGTAI
jgi:hypothetical protein